MNERKFFCARAVADVLFPRKSGKVLQVILILAFLVRLPGLFGAELDVEAAQIELSLSPFFDIAYQTAHHGVQPPLFPLLLSSISSTVESLPLVRLLPLVAGLCLVYWHWRLGCYWDDRTGVLAAFLTAIAPHLIVMSTLLTHHIWEALFVVMGLYYFWQWTQTRKFESLWVYELMMLMLLYTSAIGLFWFGAFNMAFLATAASHRAFFDNFWKRWVVNHGLLLLLYLPWLFYLPEQWQRFGAAHASPAIQEGLFSLFGTEPLYWMDAGALGPWGGFVLAVALLVAVGWVHGYQARVLETRTAATRHLSMVVMPVGVFLAAIITTLSGARLLNAFELAGLHGVVLLACVTAFWAVWHRWGESRLSHLSPWVLRGSGALLAVVLFVYCFARVEPLREHLLYRPAENPPAVLEG